MMASTHSFICCPVIIMCQLHLSPPEPNLAFWLIFHRPKFNIKLKSQRHAKLLRGVIERMMSIFFSYPSICFLSPCQIAFQLAVIKTTCFSWVSLKNPQFAQFKVRYINLKLYILLDNL